MPSKLNANTRSLEEFKGSCERELHAGFTKVLHIMSVLTITHLKRLNLVLRVLRLLGQRMVVGRDSGVLELLQCTANRQPIKKDQIFYQLPQRLLRRPPADQEAWGVWVRDWKRLCNQTTQSAVSLYKQNFLKDNRNHWLFEKLVLWEKIGELIRQRSFPFIIVKAQLTKEKHLLLRCHVTLVLNLSCKKYSAIKIYLALFKLFPWHLIFFFH